MDREEAVVSFDLSSLFFVSFSPGFSLGLEGAFEKAVNGLPTYRQIFPFLSDLATVKTVAEINGHGYPQAEARGE